MKPDKASGAFARGLLPIVLCSTIIFVVLKVTGQLTWSWTWILSPVWLPFVTLGTITILSILVFWLASGMESLYRKTQGKDRQ